MPIRTWIDVESRLVRSEAWGTFTADDILRAVDEVVEHPDFEVGFNGLSDHRRVTRVLSPLQLFRLIHHLGSIRGKVADARWAMVPGSAAGYGMARMTSVYAERIPMDFRPFWCMDQAATWARTGVVVPSGELKVAAAGPA